MNPSIRRQTLGDVLRRTALRVPGKTAIICGETQWTFAEFDAIVCRLAAGLSQMGVVHGERVAVLARNSHGFAAIRFALARLGAVLVPINFMLKAEEVAYILRHAGVRMLATDSALAEVARAAAAMQTEVHEFIWLPSE
jgi:fatty-acyl-CoA synthase